MVENISQQKATSRRLFLHIFISNFVDLNFFDQNFHRLLTRKIRRSNCLKIKQLSPRAMETTHSDKSNNEPNAKRPKMETEASTSSKPKAIDPFLSLPPDVLAKIIGYTSIAQWAALESVDKNFRAATWIAWRQLRSINVDREFLMKYETVDGRSSAVNSVGLIMQKLAERSPFLTSLSGIAELNSDTADPLAQFEHLQSLSLGDAKFVDDWRRRQEISLKAVVEFLESTGSRSSLKELHLFNVVHRSGADYASIKDRFAASFVYGREIQLPLKLETFASDWDYYSCSNTITDLRIGKARIEPDQLTSLIERSSNLRQIELSFLHCDNETHGQCNGRRLQANKKVLTALASHVKLTAISFGVRFWHDYQCTNFGPEFIEMLKSIGRRGQLRKLSLETPFEHPSIVNMTEVCATIREHIPYLRSIKLNISGLTEESVCGIVSLPELEEIRFAHCDWQIPNMPNVIKKITQLPHLERLAFVVYREDEMNSLKYLANATTLTELRNEYARLISAEVFDQWSTGIASNLEILMLARVAERNHDDENGLVRLLEKAGRLRVLILDGHITDRSLTAIAQSCPRLEVFGLRSSSNEITVQQLQEIVDRCPSLRRLKIGDKWKVGGIEDEVRNKLRFPKYRKIDVDGSFYDFDDYEED